MTSDDVATWVAERWPVDPANVAVERLTGGMINDVFRVDLGDTRVIVKHARPYVVTVPDVALSTRRLAIEARCLRELGPDGCLVDVCDAGVGVPRHIDFDAAASVLVMEDCGVIPDLSDRMTSAAPLDAGLGAALGAFTARLHAISAGCPDLLDELENRDVQETRARTQYGQVGAWVQALGRSDQAEVAHRAVELGQRLLAPG
ncbi:MAG: phosphotransferase, partial [Deltaproteobacteria bacterium]|nr:phosphotransferase [Deltaproteobacteria bacterium]